VSCLCQAAVQFTILLNKPHINTTMDRGWDKRSFWFALGRAAAAAAAGGYIRRQGTTSETEQ
jgi:hypothetical protein